MKLRSFAWLFLFCLLTALFVKSFYRQTTPRKIIKTTVPVTIKDGQNPNQKSAPDKPGAPKAFEADRTGQLHVSDDSDSKRGDFWVEQVLELSAAGAAAASKGPFANLYISIDPVKLTGLRVRIDGGAVVLEQMISAGGAEPKATVLAKGTLPKIQTGEISLAALWRKGELSIWLGSAEILSWTPEASRKTSLLEGSSGIQISGEGIRLGARRTLALNTIRFDDNFMRDSSNGAWRPAAGRWELTALAFPERSANPFSLRATFGTEQAHEDPLYRGRMRENDFGLGVVLSHFEGTLHVARITGGSPAARAGLAEDDIFIEVEGNRVEDYDPWQLQQLLLRGFGGDVRLKMLRPGEKKPREFVITREHFRWGTPAEGTPVQPVKEAAESGADRIALIVAGETGWSDYAAEVAVKPLGSGGAGLAVGVTSQQDYVLFRWRGPVDRTGNATAPVDKLQLVHVAKGKETILAEKDAGYRPYEFYRMGIDWNGADVRCLIDGNEVLAAKVPDLKRGQIALYALKGDPVFFDDVRVAYDRKALVAAHHPERVLNDIFVAEDDMEAWANPALEWNRDLKTGWAVHKSRFPGEQAVVLSKPKFSELTMALFCGANPDDRMGSLSIKDGVVRLEGRSWEAAQMRVGPGPFNRIAVRASALGAEADIDGTRLTAAGALKAAPPAGNTDGIAIRGLKNLGDPNTVRASSTNILEYTFNTSPTDWKVDSGRWGLLNKWICDPRWSWFGGRTKTLATLWNKYSFSGDISVDAHVALMMQKEELPYERPGDYNVTICGDGANLNSGYTLVFAGEDNTVTRLYRKGVPVAESKLEDHRIFSDAIKHPDKPELHQRWFHIRLEKIGNAVSFYRDGVLAFVFNDPEPLQAGRVAFWTMDNGFLLSRVRIAHGGMKPAPFEPRSTGVYSDARIVNLFDGEVFTKVEPQVLPPEIKASLDSPREAFAPADANPLPADTPAPAAGVLPQAYRVVNGAGGGPFAVQFRTLMVDPDNKGIVRFAYRIEPGAMIDLYLIDLSAVNGRNFDPRHQVCYRWRMTGPNESDEFAPLVGEIPGVKADGRWHAIQFDLQPTWRKMWRDRGYAKPGRKIMRLMFGNLANNNYLLAGIGGNAAGAAYSISDVTALAPMDIDKTPPKVSKVIWPYDPDGDGRTIQIVFDETGGGILDESLQPQINDFAVPLEALAFDAEKQTLQIDLLKIRGFSPLAVGKSLKLKLLGFQDRAQNPSVGGFEATYTFDAAQAQKAAKPVSAPLLYGDIAGAVAMLPGSAALSLFEVSPMTPIARLQESADAPPWAPAGQQRSLQVVNVTDGSAFGFALSNANYSLRRWPYLQIDYKIPFETPVNLHVYDQAGGTHALILTDTGDPRDPMSLDISMRVGPPADFVSDGMWRRMTVPLGAMLNSPLCPLNYAEVRAFSFHDNGWRGNRRAMQYWIHRVQPLPAGKAEDLKFSWQAHDVSGITDFASCVDGNPETDPQNKQELASGETLAAALGRREGNGGDLKDGWNYLHVRVKNGAGIWSQPAHLKFFLDRTPPRVARTEPAKGDAYPGQTIKVVFDEEHGIDIQGLRLNVNGRVVNPGWAGFEFDASTNTLTYNAAQAGVPWPHGSVVKVDIYGLKDLLGNAALPQSFTFNADQTLDKKGPEITQIRFVSPVLGANQHRQMSMESSFGLDFEEHLGHVHVMRDCRLDWLDNPAEAGFGKRAVKLTALDDDADVQVMLHKNPWYMDRSPLLQFDYKVDPGMRVDLLIEVLGEWMSIQFTGDGAAPVGGRKIGRVAGVKTDGGWHHASVDLCALVDAARPNLPVRIINKIILSAQGREGCKRGSSLSIDNLDLSLPSGGGGRFEWRAEADPSGIAGYSFAIDQNAAGVAPQTINYTQPLAPMGGRSGAWFVHVRACDQAGNWGPTRTMRIDFGRQ